MRLLFFSSNLVRGSIPVWFNRFYLSVKFDQKSITSVPLQSDTSVVGLCVFGYLIYVKIQVSWALNRLCKVRLG